MTLTVGEIDAIARRVVDMLDERQAVKQGPRLVDANELAPIIGMSAEWVRGHYELLGGFRLGDGPRARYRFDVDAALAAMVSSREPRVPVAKSAARAVPLGAPAVRPRRPRRAKGAAR